MIIKALRDGEWVTRERVRIYSVFIIISLIAAFGYLIATAHGVNDREGRPLGVDFSNVYAAGTYALEGKAAAAFNPVTQLAREEAIFGKDTLFYGWHYPPLFLLVAAPLARLPYGAALAVWMLVSLGLYLCSMKQILPARDVLLPALGFTAVWINAMNGNNGFITAAFFGGALALLPTRSILAGILFGCLAYKPQYGLLIPLALLAGGYWRAAFAAAFTVILLCVFSAELFGIDSWAAFFANAEFTRTVVLEQGNTGFYKMQSLFAWMRYLGSPLPYPYALHGALTLGVIYQIIRLWRKPIAYELKAAALLIGTLLVTPYSFDYDLMVLAPAIAFLVRHGQRKGFAPYEKSLLFASAIVPLAARIVAQHTDLFPGVVTLLVLMAMVLYHAQAARQEYGRSPA